MSLFSKLTIFSILILLTTAFVALPVMAHQLTAADVPGTTAEKTAAVAAHNEDPHDPTDAAVAEDHALVRSITVSKDYLTPTAPITATITFANGVASIANDETNDDDPADPAAGNDNEARHATLSNPTVDLAAGTITLQHGTRQTDGTYTWATTDGTNGARITQVIKTTVEGAGDTGSGSVYTVYIQIPESLDDPADGKYRIFAATDVGSAGGIFNPGTATMPAVKGEFTMDTIKPTVGMPRVAPQGTNLIPVSGQLSEPFRLVFDVTVPDTSADAEPNDTMAINDLKEVTFVAAPAHLTFGTPGSLGGMEYAVDVGYADTTVTAGTMVKITITATDNAGNIGMGDVAVTLAARTATGTGTGPTTPTGDTDPTGDTYSSVITIPANSFVVVVRSIEKEMGDNPATTDTVETDFEMDIGHDAILRAYGIEDANLMAWPMMPDLQDVFNTGAFHGGGALVVSQSTTQADDKKHDPGTVGISEVMWAIDESRLGQATAQRHAQWIELHNLNADPSKIILSYRTGATGISTDAAINGNLAKPTLDAVTNVFNNRPGNTFWNQPGQNGNPGTGKNFASMARILPPDNKKFEAARLKDGQYIGRYTNTTGANKSRDGRASGSWAVSTTSYARGAMSLGAGLGNVTYDYVGTPGRVNTFTPQRATVRDTRTDINPSHIIINEVANRGIEDNEYEWIELRNVHATETVNLNNYNISILTGVDKDEPFIYLPNNNSAQIPPGGVLVLTDSDPYGDADHPLAVGWNVSKNAEDQVAGLKSLGINATSKHGRYLVVQFGGHGGKFSTGLPDNGNFILIVRRPDNHENKAEGGKGRAEFGKDDLDKINDIAGYVGGLTKASYTNAVSKTDLWPLKQQGAPDDKNRLIANKVRRRQHVSTRDGRAGTGNTHNDRKAGQIAFHDVGYTGIGYRRQATNSAIHGGTPGYDNGAQKGKVLDLAMGKLVISEMMLYQGPEDARTTLPQWIEIYNPSSYPVGLGGWRLVIENPRDPIRTINLGGGSVKTILSKQTILVISGSARDIGSDTLPSSAVFPATRVYNVYKHQKAEFDMDDRFSPILDEEAFRITLIDGTALDTSKADQQPDVAGGKHLRVSSKYYAISDTVGNLDGNPRTNDTPEENGKMKFEKGMTENGDRTSLIRIFDRGVARDGTGMVKPLGATGGVDVARMNGIDSKYSWVHAADTKDRYVRHTWYGDESDWGTPLDRGGQILPVRLSSFRPTLLDGEVTIRWTTESELDNAGFNILRSDTRNGEYNQVNTDLVQGAGTTGERHSYKWVDPTAKPGVVYYYQIEDVSFAGEHQVLATTKLKGLISAKNKLTTTWSELKEASQ